VVQPSKAAIVVLLGSVARARRVRAGVEGGQKNHGLDVGGCENHGLDVGGCGVHMVLK
jgi:hypothetical protein